jgi:hypothetical protein
MPESYSFRHFRQDSDHLFNHFIELRREEPTDSLIERFRHLFIEGANYPEPEVLIALHRIARSTWADKEFSLILNRCCYILINYWWLQPELRQATVDLVELFKPPYTAIHNSQPAQRVRELVHRFTQSGRYVALQDRAWAAAAIGHATEPKNQRKFIDNEESRFSTNFKKQPLRKLIPRYPFLYPYCLLTHDSSEGGHEAIRHMQEVRERQFEQHLNRYMRTLLRRSTSPTSATMENPTLLDPKDLMVAVKRFVGKAEGRHTYRELARQFVTYSQEASSYRELKWQMYEYLTASIQYSNNPNYGKHHFNQWLEKQLEDTLPQHDGVRPTSLLLVQTCAQLIEALVANPKARPRNHIMFIDLIENLGAVFVVGLLIKLMLICQDIRASLDATKAYLSKRFAGLINHYSSALNSELGWLVESLETLMVAFSVHFGRADFSWVTLT